jgi:hypothetical protein
VKRVHLYGTVRSHLNTKAVLLKKKFIHSTYFRKIFHILGFTSWNKGTAVAQWLRYCATNRKVASSIPDDVTGIFH